MSTPVTRDEMINLVKALEMLNRVTAETNVDLCVYGRIPVGIGPKTDDMMAYLCTDDGDYYLEFGE